MLPYFVQRRWIPIEIFIICDDFCIFKLFTFRCFLDNKLFIFRKFPVQLLCQWARRFSASRVARISSGSATNTLGYILSKFVIRSLSLSTLEYLPRGLGGVNGLYTFWTALLFQRHSSADSFPIHSRSSLPPFLLQISIVLCDNPWSLNTTILKICPFWVCPAIFGWLSLIIILLKIQTFQDIMFRFISPDSSVISYCRSVVKTFEKYDLSNSLRYQIFVIQ